MYFLPFLWLMVFLAVIATVGHLIWIGVRAFFGLLFGISGNVEKAIPVEICPRCGELVTGQWGSRSCGLCGWSSNGESAGERPAKGRVLDQLCRRVEQYEKAGLITGDVRVRLVKSIEAERPPSPAAAIEIAGETRPIAAKPPPTVHPVKPRVAATTEGPIPAQAAKAAVPRPSKEPIAEKAVERVAARAEAYRAARAAEPPALAPLAPVPTVKRPEAPAKPPAQPFTKLLSAFLEEKNIRWGELLGGLLIVGCSLALVISFWASIAERPWLKFGLFNGVTALLFAVGFYAERRWRLPTTAAGLLIIASLLTPLNFLAVASLTRGPASDSPGGWLGEGVAIVLFAVLCFQAGRYLVQAAPWALAAGVVVPSAAMFLIRRLAGPELGATSLMALGSLPLAAHAASVGGFIRSSRGERDVDEPSAIGLLRVLGLTGFATLLAVGLLVTRSGPAEAVLHRLAPLFPLAGAPALAAGLWLWHKITAKSLAGYRTAGTSIAAAGLFVSLAAIVVPWPDPAGILLGAGLNTAVLMAVALGFEIPAAHAMAGACLSLTYVVGWLMASGRLNGTAESSAHTALALGSRFSGLILLPLVVFWLFVTIAAARKGRTLTAQALAVVASLVAVVSLGLVGWHGMEQGGEPIIAAWVFAAYTAVSLAAAAGFGRWPLFPASRGLPEVRGLSWLASALLFAALVLGLVLGARQGTVLSIPWTDVLLTHASLSLGAALLLSRLARSRPETLEAVRVALGQPVVPAAAAGFAALLLQAPFAPVSSLAIHLCWLAVIWLVLAWNQSSPAMFAVFQAALSGAVVAGAGVWLTYQSWFHGDLRGLDPWSLQAMGIALGLLGLVWSVLRLLVRRWPAARDSKAAVSLARLRGLLDPGWTTLDRVMQGVLIMVACFLALYAAVPGVAQELAPRSMAARWAGEAEVPGVRVVVPSAVFELADLPHAHAIGAGSWVLLGLIVTMIAVSQWQAVRRGELLTALAVAALGVPLLAGRWESQVASASALRWASAGFLLVGSALVWGRDWLAGRGRRLGWPLAPERGDTEERLAPFTLAMLLLGLLPLFLMALYTSGAALADRPPDPGLATLWMWIGGLFVVMAGLGLSLRAYGASEDAGSQFAASRAWMQPASHLSLLLGVLPLIAVSGFAISSALVGNPVVGPEPGTFFARIGNAGSYVPPVLLLAATLLGYAIRERSNAFAFAAALVLNVAATMGYLMAGAAGRLTFDAELWVRLAQLNAAVAAASAVIWLIVLATWPARGGQARVVEVPAGASTLIALAIALNLLMLGAATVALWFQPVPAPAVQALGAPLGWISFGLTVAAFVLQGRVAGNPVVPRWLGMGLVGGAAMLALGTANGDPGNWRTYHEMLANQGLAGLALVLVGWSRAWPDPSSVSRSLRRGLIGWSTLALAIVVAYSLGAEGTWDPQSPWWAIGGLGVAVLIAVGLSGWTGFRGYLVLSAVLFNVAASLAWWASPWWSPAGWWRGSPQIDWLDVQVLALALPAPFWLWWERRMTQRAQFAGVDPAVASAARRPRPLQRFVSWLAMAGLALVVLLSLSSAGDPGGLPNLVLGWLTLAAVLVAFAVGLWDGSIRGSLSGLYLLALCAAGWALVPLRLSSEWLLWLGTVILAAHAVATSFLWSRRASFRPMAERLGISMPVKSDPESSPSLLIVANLVLTAIVGFLSFGAILTDPDVIRRTTAADAVLASVLAIGLLAWGRRRSLLQSVSLGVGVVGVIAWGWAWLQPGAANSPLDRMVVVFAALVGSAVVYGLGLAKFLPRFPEWTRAAQRIVPGLLVLSPLALAAVIGAEIAALSRNESAPMSGWAVMIVAATFLTAIAAALIAAVVPGRDPLGLSERGRQAYVYGAEVLLAILALHLKMTMPWLFGGFFTQFWPLILLGVAFLGIGLSELFHRQGREVLAEPLERTGAFLPVLPLMAGLYWTPPRPGEDVVFLIFAGVLYLTLSALRSSWVFGALAGLAFNGALWTLLGHTQSLGLMRHPQLWIIPPAICVLLGSYWNRDRLTASQLAAIRYAAAVMIYISSLGDIALTGVAQAPWLPGVLALLGILGIFAGIWLRVRGFLYLGVGAVCLAIFTIIWYAAVDLHQSWLWWACGIVSGILILVLFGLFEKKRQDILRVVDELKAWSP